jgi:5'(3')-deoxyribonucleotidase
MEDKGLRHNEGKTRYDLLPAFAQDQFAKVLTKGAEKYAARNWELGMKWSKVLASLKRHLAAIERGEDYDNESGLLHSAHVMTNAAFLTEYYKIYPQGDDRPHAYLNRPRIGLDIDEVLCDWVGAWIKKYNLPQPTAWSFDGSISTKFEAMRKIGILDIFYADLKPKCKPEDIPFEPHCYITSRPVSTEVSAEWLKNNGFPVRPVITVPYGQSKVSAAKEAGVEIFVDDSYKNFVDLNNAGICCYLFDAPHNQRYQVGHKRIKSLNELA